jgi:hypothetical protein
METDLPNLDAGLIRINDLNDWATDIYGLENVGDGADLNEMNLGVPLIDQRVSAIGTASGRLDGTTKVLF